MKRTAALAIIAATLALTGCADWPVNFGVTYQDDTVTVTGSKSGLTVTGKIDRRSGK